MALAFGIYLLLTSVLLSTVEIRAVELEVGGGDNYQEDMQFVLVYGPIS